jgi:primary-amine oxidase
VTVVNYEYAIYWTFYQDGTINFQIKATGELSTNLLAQGEDPAGHGTIVAEGINGQFHQHLFSVRLDTMIDGLKNTVSTVDVEPLEEEFGSKENPYGQGFRLREEVLENSADSRTSVSPATSRIWKISNESEIHPITKKPTAWKLIPMNSAPLMAKKGSKIRARAGFAEHSVWVTKQKDEEMFAAGFYVNQSRGGDGLPSWISREDSIVNEDIVLWHTFGVTHIPRVEDFPVMPVETCGFTLKPNCFFTANPALDVPPSSKEVNKSQLVNCH